MAPPRPFGTIWAPPERHRRVAAAGTFAPSPENPPRADGASQNIWPPKTSSLEPRASGFPELEPCEDALFFATS
eukprot:2922558-Pyramimonas_sp.AAC.1